MSSAFFDFFEMPREKFCWQLKRLGQPSRVSGRVERPCALDPAAYAARLA
jgi:hypothetical protein